MGHGRPHKIFLTSSLITMQNLVPVSHAVCTYVESPKNFQDANASHPRPPPTIWGMADSLETCSSLNCYIPFVEFFLQII